MAKAELVAPRMEHVEQLAQSMRAEDAAEVMASGFSSPRDALMKSLGASSRSFTLLLDGEVAAIFGVGEKRALKGGRDEANIWALTGEAVTRNPIAFARICRPALQLLLKDLNVVWNFVDARYPKAVRWAQWLGFEVGPATPFGPDGQPFHPIRIRQ